MFLTDDDENVDMSETTEEEQEFSDEDIHLWNHQYVDLPYSGPYIDEKRVEIEVLNENDSALLVGSTASIQPGNYARYSNRIQREWERRGSERLIEWKNALVIASAVSVLLGRPTDGPSGDQPDMMISGVLTPTGQWIYKYADQEMWTNRARSLHYMMMNPRDRRNIRTEVLYGDGIEDNYYAGLQAMFRPTHELERWAGRVFEQYILSEEKQYYPPPFKADNLQFIDGNYAELTFQHNGSFVAHVLDGVLKCKHCKRRAKYSHREGKWYCEICRQLDYWYKHDDDCINLGWCVECENFGIAGYECWYCTVRQEPMLNVDYLFKRFGHRDLKEAPIWWMIFSFSNERLWLDPAIENFMKYMMDHHTEIAHWNSMKEWASKPVDKDLIYFKYMVCNDPKCDRYEKMERSFFCRGCGKDYKTAPWSTAADGFCRVPIFKEQHDGLKASWMIVAEESWMTQNGINHKDPFYMSAVDYLTEIFGIIRKHPDKVEYLSSFERKKIPMEELIEQSTNETSGKGRKPKRRDLYTSWGSSRFIRVVPNIKIPRCLLVEDQRRSTNFTMRFIKISREDYNPFFIYHNDIIRTGRRELEANTEHWTTPDFIGKSPFYIGKPASSELEEEYNMWRTEAKNHPFTPRKGNYYDPTLEPSIDENGDKISKDKYAALDQLFMKNGGNTNFISTYQEATK